MSTNPGISALAMQVPEQALDVRELAALRGVDPNKLTLGLGCGQMALCRQDQNVVDLAAGAAERALEQWGGDRSRLRLLAVGTESALDMSRPLSAWVADSLRLSGALRSYEVKHACYGGTLALQQALEWKRSGAGEGQAALVIAADVALYAPKDPGEPTQGAGAVAFVVDDDARVAEVGLRSYPYSEPAFDFWRPVGEAFPRVEGQLSLDCYKKATVECFGALVGRQDPKAALDRFEALCFHVPFPKMVKKAVICLGEAWGWGEAEVAALFEEKVSPTLENNRRIGNAYTASLWLSVAGALAGMKRGARLAAFSYGSGFGSELLTLSAGPACREAVWQKQLEADLEAREQIDAATYDELRSQQASK